MKDDLDGIEIRLKADADSIEVAKVVTSVLNHTHHEVQDFSVTIPAALLAQQRRTQTIFTYVMVAIAAISLLVGGIGIMNIVLATVMERTREIGIRRSVGARRFDIVRQFLTESVLISMGGGLMGIGFGFFLAWLIARTAEWKTIVTTTSVVLQKPERYAVQLGVKKNADGTVKQPLFACALDDTPWLSEDEAIAHVLKIHFATFYSAERTATEPPKGKYTFVAQCGMSGIILGPPNYHDYQNQLRKLHTERFSRMPFDAFKSRVKIVRDEEVVKKWIEDQSFKTEYTCLNVPRSEEHTSELQSLRHLVCR